MRLSQMLLGTLREAPSDAEAVSHKLMFRSGMIRKTASGFFTYLPIGTRVLNNILTVIREEMEKEGIQECNSFELIPEEMLKETIKSCRFEQELFKIRDNNQKVFYAAPDINEVVVEMIKNEIKSYKMLPLNIFQTGKRFRDEAKPKNGVLRSRSFMSCDCFSFDTNTIEMNNSFLKYKMLFDKILKRCRLEVECIDNEFDEEGKPISNEYIVRSELGDEEVAFCKNCGNGLNVKYAATVPDHLPKEEMREIEKATTPNARTIDDLEKFFHVYKGKFVKTIIYHSDEKIISVMVRGDREINEERVKMAIKSSNLELGDEETVRYATSAEIGFAGPIGIKTDVLLVDEELQYMNNYYCGANETGYHYANVNYGRDFSGTIGHFRKLQEGDICPKCGGTYELKKCINIGKIKKIGDYYSQPLRAVFLDENGENKPLQSICGSIGIDRLIAAIIEKHNDENGIVWPIEMAPYKVIIVVAVYKNIDQMQAAQELYNELKGLGIDVLLDDRDERAGVKFKDADIIGIPIRITVGKKINDGMVEFKLRGSSEVETIEIGSVAIRVIGEFEKESSCNS